MYMFLILMQGLNFYLCCLFDYAFATCFRVYMFMVKLIVKIVMDHIGNPHRRNLWENNKCAGAKFSGSPRHGPGLGVWLARSQSEGVTLTVKKKKT